MKLSSQLLSLILATLLLLPLVGSTPATQQRQNDQDGFVVRVNTDLVTLDVTVTDPQGNYLLDLKVEDFELLEDGVTRPIEFFQPMRALQNAPLALVIALDLSGSLSADETVVQRQAIKQFLQWLDNHSLCALLGFNHQINILQDFTNDRQRLTRSLDKIKDYGGSTRIYDALDRSITLFKKAPTMRGGKRLRRVIVVVTDGFDSASVIDKKELIRRANLSGVTIYSVTLPSYAPSLSGSSSAHSQRLPTLLDIARITDSTGGRDFSVEGNDFAAVFKAIAQELAASYTIAYHPPRDKQLPEFHKLQVRVKRDGALVRVSRDGYNIDIK
ncbi:MAG: VWA domain-containing protein [Acidobacteriota bacterium]